MGNECSKVCSNGKKKSRSTTVPKQELAFRSSLSSDRETINEFSIENCKQVIYLANSSNIADLRDYLEQGFLVDYPLDQSGWTLLHLACQKNSLSLLTTLLEFKPFIDAQEIAEGWTPLMICSMNNYAKLAGVLIDHGASTRVQDKSGKTARQLAEKYRSEQVLEIF